MLVNASMWGIFHSFEGGTIEQILFFIATLLQNITFTATILINPGMLSRDPGIHSLEYLKKTAKYN